MDEGVQVIGLRVERMLERLPLRGGNWNNGATAGVFAMNLNNARSNSNSNIGFRPALGGCLKSSTHGSTSSATPKGPAILGHVPKYMNRRGRDGRSQDRTFGVADLTQEEQLEMAKTYNNLYVRIYDFENLYTAYLKARKGKRYKREVLEFSVNLEENLIQLQNELIWRSYQTGPYHLFQIYEPKERTVAALPFRDRVLQHAVISVIEPIWEARFIYDSYACRPGKGTHAGADRAEALLRKVKRQHGWAYALKADIAKYFLNIDHKVLRALLRKRITCRDTLALLDEIVASTADPRDLRPHGIPIGNLTSQLFANIYLHELDEFVKYKLRERHYLRYMDDFVVVHHNKQHLHQARRTIETFLDERLKLHTNHKTQVFPVCSPGGRPLDFLGYRIWSTHRKLRKDSAKRMRRKLKHMAHLFADGKINFSQIHQRIQSWLGHASHANTYQLRKHIMSSVAFIRGGPPPTKPP